jgi:hypothetical protein
MLTTLPVKPLELGCPPDAVLAFSPKRRCHFCRYHARAQQPVAHVKKLCNYRDVKGRLEVTGGRFGMFLSGFMIWAHADENCAEPLRRQIQMRCTNGP